MTATTLAATAATSTLLARANAAWVTDPRGTAHPPPLPRRHGPAVWITSRAGRPAPHIGIVVHAHRDRRVPLAALEPTLLALADDIDADTLLLLTNQIGVVTGHPVARLVKQASPRALPQLSHPAGATTPAIRAACWFADATGRRAAIGRLDQVAELLAGTAGTQVVPGAPTVLAEAPTTEALAS